MRTGELCTAVVLASLSATAAPHGRPAFALRIRLMNRAGVPRRVFEGIEREAARVLDKAGIRLELRDCRRIMGIEPSGCSAPAAPDEVLVELLPGHCHTRDEVLGYARPGLYAAVFLGRAEDLAREQIASREDILAHIIVHEATHMLTGGRHSAAGVMHAVWGLQDLKEIATRGQSLNSREVEEIRAVMARLDRPPQ